MPTPHNVRQALKQSGTLAALDFLHLADERVGKEVVRWWIRNDQAPGPVLDAILSHPKAGVRLSLLRIKRFYSIQGPVTIRYPQGIQDPPRATLHTLDSVRLLQADFPKPNPWTDAQWADFWCDYVFIPLIRRDSSVVVRRNALIALLHLSTQRVVQVLASPGVSRSLLVPSTAYSQITCLSVVFSYASRLETAWVRSLTKFYRNEGRRGYWPFSSALSQLRDRLPLPGLNDAVVHEFFEAPPPPSSGLQVIHASLHR